MKNNQGTLGMYTVGFLLSIGLTLGAYFTVSNHLFTRAVLVPVIIGLAMVQLLVQLIFFLHLEKGSQPRWNVLVFLFTALVVAILVFGSLWIMKNLNYNGMTPADTTNQILHDEGIPR